ncbi:acyl-CoA dehydrogenase family protein [Pendulispora brunnea]|uniref:Dibenzothiophene monooxygenase n=1 Tax=Pendulispora brunnea TaxID=2905690 RepID=A0ABZ2K767_9BACT
MADPLAIASNLAADFETTAVARDREGGTPKSERDALRASGLLALSIPASLGGAGADWPTILRSVRIIARADGALAHVYGFQHLLLATVRLFGTPAQYESLARETAERHLFWGNALNPLDDRATLSRDGDDFVLRGEKSFCSGARDADILVVSALDASTRKLLVGAIPANRTGIVARDDWDNMGQRQTDSGSVLFENVRIQPHELLAQPGPLGSTFATLRPLIAQLTLANVYLGIAEGALEAARRITRERGKAWFASGVERAVDDPYILGIFGELYVELEAARHVTDAAGVAFERAWARGDALSADERGAVAVAVASAKVTTTRVGLEVTTRMFDTAGARATTARLGLDRFWRNLRTHTLHDPVDYKRRDLGRWFLTDALPAPSFYS